MRHFNQTEIFDIQAKLYNELKIDPKSDKGILIAKALDAAVIFGSLIVDKGYSREMLKSEFFKKYDYIRGIN